MTFISKESLKKIQELDEKARLSIRDIEESLSVSNATARIYRALLDNDHLFQSDEDLVASNVRLAKQKQRYMDSNRIERKSFREYARVENTLEALNKALIEQFDKVDFEIADCQSSIQMCDRDTAIVQLSDTHFNELVDLSYNRYDFGVASKRLALYASEIKRVLSTYCVTKIVVAMTGDMINSDRRLDEKLNMSTNRMTAALLATNLIQYFINDLATAFQEIDVVYVTGNESRVDEFGFTDMVVTDNYDSLIFNMLKLLYRDADRVHFIDSNPVETVISLNGKNILLFHGTTVGRDTQAGIQKIIGKYAAKGTTIDYALFGHIHFANCTDLYARSGSLVGNNTYSDFGINLISKASQNLTIIKENGAINTMRIELDDVSYIEGYPIEKDLDAYNAKSAAKLHTKHKVIEIII